MSVSAAGYILNVPSNRRELLLYESENGGSFRRPSPFVAEPVSNFEHSRRAPLVVFASFEDGKITHIADGKKGVSAGTGLARLNMQDLKALARQITFDELQDGVSARVRAHLKRVLTEGGMTSAEDPRCVRRSDYGTRRLSRRAIGSLFRAPPVGTE